MTLLAPNMKNITRQKTLVFGLGVTGYSCVNYLVKEGHDVQVFDTRLKPPYLERLYREFPQVEVLQTEFDLNLLGDVRQIIASPGISLSSSILKAATQQGIAIVGDVQLFSDKAQAPIIAITGSNGKTTTTQLIADMFENAGRRVKVGGNIGVPVLDLLVQDVPDVYVIELSSFQLETTPNLKCDVAVVLNISEDHMDRYESFDHYARSKLAIYNNATHKLLNLDDHWLAKQVNKDDSTVGFTCRAPENQECGLRIINDEQWVSIGEALIYNTSHLKLKGRHQLYNAIVAVVVGELYQLPRNKISETLNTFEGLAHRTQFVAEVNGVTYINDSKGTNVGATIAAVQGVDASIVLIAGGDSKGANFSGFGQALEKNVKYLVLIGRDASLIEREINGLIPVIRAINLSAAVKLASKIAKPEDCVLLSPACASFDMFDNYQHRGDVFIKAVKALS